MSESPLMQKVQRVQAALAAWEKEHPELAAAWDEAVAVEEALKQARGRARLAELHRAAVDAACLAVGLPKRALKALEALKDTTAVRELHLPEGGIALLSGPLGTGKTVAAVLLARKALADALAANPERTKEAPERTALFVRAVTLARTSAWGADGGETLARVRTTRLLVLDDLGAEYASPVWDMLLFELLDSRHGDMLSTVVTTNLGGDALKARYGGRFAERISEGGSVLYLNGESMRRQS